MRNWNSAFTLIPTLHPPILSYLWGIETCLFSFLVLTSKPDFILPMRNWNKDHRSALCIGFRGFYLTYEELKLLNGSVKSLPSYWILSYLWGIETQSRALTEDNLLWILSYLWGIETEHKWILSRREGRILSYLWGIETGIHWPAGIQG